VAVTLVLVLFTTLRRRLRILLSATKGATSSEEGEDEAILERSAVEPTGAAVQRAFAECAVASTLRDWVASECEARGWRCEFLKEAAPSREEVFCVGIVSLSGGVDSMVITRVLCDLRDRARLSGEKTFGVACVHVDYGNRPESGAEAAYLRRWCETRRVRLDVTEMPEDLRRGTTPRDDYERGARTARFAAYERTLAAVGKRCAVLLGHHRGDVQENCLSNALRGASVLALSGMAKEDSSYGVRVARPLLVNDKAAVYDVAHRLGVPYFKDTTPKWSTRGRLRGEVLPLLRDVYGSGCGRNLERLADEADALADLVSHRVFRPFHDGLCSSRAGVAAPVRAYQREGPFFWRSVLRDLAHGLGLGALSEKALRVFLSKLHTSNFRGWLELKRGWLAFLDVADNGGLFLFASRFFDDAHAPAALDGTQVHVTAEEHRLGACWRVTASFLSDEDTSAPPPWSLRGSFFEADPPQLAHDVLMPEGDDVLVVHRRDIRKYKPLQALDALTDSQHLRDAVPLLVPSSRLHNATADDGALTRRVRVTYVFRGPPPEDASSSSSRRE